MTKALRQRLLDRAKRRIAWWVERCRVQPGRGVVMQGDGLRLVDTQVLARAAPEAEMGMYRQLIRVMLEKRGQRCGVNFPPVGDVLRRWGGSACMHIRARRCH